MSDQRAAKAPYGNVQYADPGYQEDGVKRYPLDSEAHCRAAWSYINMPKNQKPYTAEQVSQIKSRIKAAGKKYGITFEDGRDMEDDFSEQERNVARDAEFERSVPFENGPVSDGWTLEGYAAVFDTPALIRDMDGEFDEVIRRGAFTESLREQPPVIMFDHGKHPLIGEMPLGRLLAATEDSRGLHIKVAMSQNWLMQPVRDAIADGGVTGMSFRLKVPQGGERWSYPTGGREQRELLRIVSREMGPVVFPAYRPTTAQVRSVLEHIETPPARPPAEGEGGESASAQDRQSQLDRSRRDRMLRWNERRIFTP
jgi:HK97 family phage prohead protease